MSERGGKIIDFSTHLHSNLNKKLYQAQKENHDLVCALRELKSSQRKISKVILSVVICNDLASLLSVICNELSYSFSCDVVRLGIESELMSEHESYYPEHNYSGLSFLPLGYCIAIFADKNHLIINDNHFKRLLFSDCNDLAQSSLYLRLHLPNCNRDAVIAFGTKEAHFFIEKKHDFELLDLMAQVFSVKLDKLLQQEAGLL